MPPMWRRPANPAYRADDALWLFPTVYKYVAETGTKPSWMRSFPLPTKTKGPSTNI